MSIVSALIDTARIDQSYIGRRVETLSETVTISDFAISLVYTPGFEAFERELTETIALSDSILKGAAKKLYEILGIGGFAVQTDDSSEWTGHASATISLDQADKKSGRGSIKTAVTAVDATWYETQMNNPPQLAPPLPATGAGSEREPYYLSFWFKCTQASSWFNPSSYVRLRKNGVGGMGWRVTDGDWVWAADTWTYIRLPFSDPNWHTGAFSLADIDEISFTPRTPDAGTVDFDFWIDQVKIEVEGLQKAVIKAPINETISLLDSVTRETLRTLTDTITLSDSIIKTTGRSLVETLNLQDSFARVSTLFRTLSDSLSIMDDIDKSVTKPLAESITLVDTVTSRSDLFRSLSDSISLSGVVTLGAGKMLVESITLSDAVLRDSSYIKLLNETILLSDTFSEVVNWYRTFTETILLDDSIDAFKLLVIVLTETITLTDTLTWQVDFLRTLNETINLVPTLTKYTTLAPLTETITLVDTVLKLFPLLLTETITLNDNLIKKADYFREFSEIVSLSDSYLRLAGKSLTDQIGIADIGLTKQTGKPLAETLALADLITLGTARTLTESIGLTDSFERAVSWKRLLAETITLVDTAVIGGSFQLILTEILTLNDTLTRVVDFNRIFTESLTLVDTVNAFRLFVLRLTETISLTDTLERAVSKNFQEILTITDVLNKIVLATFTETLSLIATMVPGKVFIETLSLSDSITKDITKEFIEVIFLRVRMGIIFDLIIVSTTILDLLGSRVQTSLLEATIAVEQLRDKLDIENLPSKLNTRRFT